MKNLDFKKKGIKFRLLVFKNKQLKSCPLSMMNEKTMVYASSYKKSKISSIASYLKKLNGYVIIQVDYGKHKDNFGKIGTFDNSGCYDTIQDFREALDAFTEKDLIDYITS